MAVLKDAEAVVVINGQEVAEYEDNGTRDYYPDDTVSSGTVNRYVEVTAGGNFELKFEAKANSFNGYNGLQFWVHIDGIQVDNARLRPQETGVIQGVRRYGNGTWVIQKFQFASLLLGQYSITHPNIMSLT